MNFAPEYFLEEEREGFIVQPLMKRVWAAQLEVLHEIDTICERHQIKYFAQWGTLLGAVRHHGFIPWDDDLDICMLREDYVRFLHYAGQELPQGYQVHDYNEEGFDELMSRVTNGDQISWNPAFLNKFHGCPYVVGVDIFCMDHIPKDKEEERIMLTLLHVADSLGKYWDSYELDPEGRAEQVRELESLTGYHITEDQPIGKQLLALADKICAMYWDAESDEVGFPCLLIDNPSHRLPASVFNNIIEVPFENTTMPIPADYDVVLRANYGSNYMTPNRNWSYSHDYPFFRDQIGVLKAFFEQNDVEVPGSFDMRLE